MTPNKEAIKILVDALRSDEYKQGITYLHCGTKSCIWGVACRVYQQQHPPRQQLTVGYGSDGVVTYDGHSAAAPTKVQKWLGIDHEQMFEAPGVGKSLFLYSLNDIELLSFPKLADLLEKEFLQPPPTPLEA